MTSISASFASPSDGTLYASVLEVMIAHDLNPLAGAVVRLLSHHARLTLSEVAKGVGNIATTTNSASVKSALLIDERHTPSVMGATQPALRRDAAVREVVTRLFLHRVVSFDESSRTYSLLLSSALLLRVFHPLVLHHINSRFGEAARILAAAVHRLGVVELESILHSASSGNTALPVDSLLTATAPPHASHATPSRRDLEAAAQVLLAEGYLERTAYLAPSVEEPETSGGEARRLRTEASTSSSSSSTLEGHSLVRWSVPVCIRALRELAILQQVSQWSVDRELARGVVRELLHQPSFSTSISALQRALPTTATTSARLTELFEQLGAYSASHPHAGGGGAGDDMAPALGIAHGDTVQLYMDVLYQHIQRTLVEQVVYARHGVLGVRIVKLLLWGSCGRHQFLEDKAIAELVIGSQPTVRETLHQMMQSGLIRQMEVSKSDGSGPVLGERQPRHHVYLWGCGGEGGELSDYYRMLLPNVHSVVIQSLHKALLLLLAGSQQHQQPSSSSLGSLKMEPALRSGGGAPLTGPELEAALVARRQRVGLEGSVLSLLRMAFVMAHFSSSSCT